MKPKVIAMERRKRERKLPESVKAKINKQVKCRIKNQALWRLNNGFDYNRTTGNRALCELDSGGCGDVLLNCCVGGIYVHEGNGVFKEIV